jgi:hypothetical protein
MKPRSLALSCLSIAAGLALSAQEPPPEPLSIPVEPMQPEVVVRTPGQLDELFGPIALYPDSLIALILPASTYPTDIVLAARFQEKGGNLETVDEQGWDESVEALARFPEVVRWLDENLEWTIQVGEAFADQPVDVMKSIQRLRAAAREAGTLVDTPEQQVLVEGERILIVPAQPDVIYVPVYDPAIVYVRHPGIHYTEPFCTFGSGFRTGWWMTYDCNWTSYQIWWANPPHYNQNHYDWRYPRFPGHPGYVQDPYRRPWQPPPVRRHVARPDDNHARTQPVVRPIPFDESRYSGRSRPHGNRFDEPPRDFEQGQPPTPGRRPDDVRFRVPVPGGESGGPTPAPSYNDAPTVPGGSGGVSDRPPPYDDGARPDQGRSGQRNSGSPGQPRPPRDSGFTPPTEPSPTVTPPPVVEHNSPPPPPRTPRAEPSSPPPARTNPESGRGQAGQNRTPSRPPNPTTVQPPAPPQSPPRAPATSTLPQTTSPATRSSPPPSSPPATRAAETPRTAPTPEPPKRSPPSDLDNRKPGSATQEN